MKYIIFAIALLLSQISYSNQIRSSQIRDGEISRADINTIDSGSALILRLLAGEDINLASTGADSGTGDVTVSVGEDIPRLDEINTFTRRQEIVSASDSPLLTLRHAGPISIGFQNFPSTTTEASIYYRAGPNQIILGTGNAGNDILGVDVDDETIRGFDNQAKDFADPTDIQDLATRAYVYDSAVTNDVPRINDSTVRQTYLDSGTSFNLPATGDYIVSVNFRYSLNSTITDFIADLDVNGTIFNIIRIEPQDAAGTGITAINVEAGISETTGTNQRFSSHKEIVLRGQSAGVLPVSLLWDTASDGVEATIYEAVIRVKRLTF